MSTGLPQNQVEPFMSVKARSSQVKLFVGGLSIRTTDEQLYEYMSKFGQIAHLNIVKSNKKSKGFAFLVFEDFRVAEHVCIIPHSLNGKTFNCKITYDEDWNYSKILEQKHRKIFVREVPSNASESDLDEYFSQFGRVERVTINKNLDESRKGTAFIQFSREAAVAEILSLPSNLHFLKGRKMKVFECYTKKEVQLHSRIKTQALPQSSRTRLQLCPSSKVDLRHIQLASPSKTTYPIQHAPRGEVNISLGDIADISHPNQKTGASQPSTSLALASNNHSAQLQKTNSPKRRRSPLLQCRRHAYNPRPTFAHSNRLAGSESLPHQNADFNFQARSAHLANIRNIRFNLVRAIL